MSTEESKLPEADKPVDSCASGSRWPVVGARSMCAAIGLACLFSPLLIMAAVWHISPVTVEALSRKLTGLNHNTFMVAQTSGEQVRPETARFLRKEYPTRMAIELVVRTWNAWGRALVLSAALSLLAFLLDSRARRAGEGSSRVPFRAGAALLFLIVSAAIAAVLWPTLRCLPFGMAAALVFVLNFPLGRRMAERGFGAQAWLVSGLGALIFVCAGVLHVLMPAVVLGFAASCCAPASRAARRVAVAAGRVLACGGSFLLLSLVLLSARPVPLSPGVSRLLAADELYDVCIDPVQDRLLVTDKNSVYQNPAYAFQLEDPFAAPQKFLIPSAETEYIQLDVASRRIYHIDRLRKQLLALDADRLTLKGTVPLPRGYRGDGSVMLAFAPSANRLFAAWENNYLTSIDLTDGRWSHTFAGQTPLILCDETNGVLYLLSRDLPNLLALDILSMEARYRSDVTPPTANMAISHRRGELYVPEVPGSKMWVFATPRLRLLRKLDAGFGVRALAFDEEHGLLIAGNFLSGRFDVLDPETGRSLKQFQVGPYCRRIALDMRRRHAFVTLRRHGLYMICY